MNTTGLCDRFEREGVLRIERGLPLDTHFDACADCEVARHKYETLLSALPKAQPETSPPLGWQSRVLRAAAESDAARPAISMAGWGKPFAWTAMAGAAALAVAAFVPRTVEFDVQAETHAAAPVPEFESPIEEVAQLPTGEDQESDAKPLPPPVAPKSAPKQPAPLAQPMAPMAPEMTAPRVSPTKPAPNAQRAMMNPGGSANSSAQTVPQARKLQVVRPDKLYGFNLKYPPAAMKAKIQGETSVQCTIRADGRNTNCRILKSLPYLDSAVIRAVESARSEPIRVNGRPVDHSDHIWHITIHLRERVDDRTSARGLPTLNWDY